MIKSIDRGVILNIELKGPNTSEGSLEMANKYIKLGEINSSDILFSSFNWKEIISLKKIRVKNVKIALITEDDPLKAIPIALTLNAVAINPNYKKLNQHNIEKMSKFGS